MAELDSRRAEILANAARIIQRQIRTHIARKEFIELRQAAILLQSNLSEAEGRIKVCEGMNIDMVLDEEIHKLTEKLQRLQKRSGSKDSKATRNNRNFDKQVSVLQRQLEKIGG
ncbi:hypothetical protein RIF29_19661 [Crotalaria pallida]|uniref:Uncharacterized protein n=1 Tax=Crotalaria pallida TaxID=3830 RepID=A0AAN9EZW8_CROPI